MVGDNEANFSHKLLLTNRQVSNLRKAFANYYQKILSHQKWYKPEGFLGRLLGPLLKTGLPLIKNMIKQLAESV